MKRTFKYYLKLNKVQKQKLDHILELCCWLHNYLLEQFRTRDKNGEKQPTEFQLINSLPEVKKQHPFLKEVHSSNLQEVAKLVFKIWKRYKELKNVDPKKKYPKPKPVHRHNSIIYSSPLERINGCGYKVDNSPLSKKKEVRKLKLALGQQNHHNIYLKLKLVMERSIQGKVKTLTIKRKNGRYYALFSCDNVEAKPLPAVDNKVGIDLNLTKQSYITLSNGKKYKHPKHYRKAEKILKIKQDILNRKTQKSNNWLKAKSQLAKKWERVVNQFKYYSRQVANEIVRDYDKIVVENLHIDKMVQDSKLSQSIYQARWGILIKVLAEEAEIATRQLVKVNPKNTSQTCSLCGEFS